jgi:O-6-methylguanine DNA methyltransferase
MAALAGLCGDGHLDRRSSKVNRFWYQERKSPIGTILLAGDEDTLVALDYIGYRSRMERLLAARFGDYHLSPGRAPAAVENWLDAYFASRWWELNDIPVRLGGTAFQERVWTALRQIPAGETRTYGQLAEAIGNPKAARAVGHANSLNPVAIVVPCHRVIGAGLRLTGYAGGLERKQWLLEHEKGAIGGKPR